MIVPGLALLLAVIIRDFRQFAHHPAIVGLFFPVVLLGEMFPIQIVHHGEEEEVDHLDHVRRGPADPRRPRPGHRGHGRGLGRLRPRPPPARPPGRVQRGPVQPLPGRHGRGDARLLAPTLIGRGHLVTGDIGAIVVGAIAYFTVNNTLPAIAIAMTRELPIGRFLLNDIALQATIAGLALAMVPLVVAVTGYAVDLLPVLTRPRAHGLSLGRQPGPAGLRSRP